MHLTLVEKQKHFYQRILDIENNLIYIIYLLETIGSMAWPSSRVILIKNIYCFENERTYNQNKFISN